MTTPDDMVLVSRDEWEQLRHLAGCPVRRTNELGVTIAPSNSEAVVHYQDCPYYLRAVNTHIMLRASARLRLCRLCRPSEEDVRDHPPTVTWDPFSHTPGPTVQVFPGGKLESAEKVAARRSLGIGRTPSRPKGWSE